MNRKDFLLNVVRFWKIKFSYKSTILPLALSFSCDKYLVDINKEYKVDQFNVNITDTQDKLADIVTRFNFTIPFSDFTESELKEIDYLCSIRTDEAIASMIDEIGNAINKQ